MYCLDARWLCHAGQRRLRHWHFSSSPSVKSYTNNTFVITKVIQLSNEVLCCLPSNYNNNIALERSQQRRRHQVKTNMPLGCSHASHIQRIASMRPSKGQASSRYFSNTASLRGITLSSFHVALLSAHRPMSGSWSHVISFWSLPPSFQVNTMACLSPTKSYSSLILDPTLYSSPGPIVFIRPWAAIVVTARSSAFGSSVLPVQRTTYSQSWRWPLPSFGAYHAYIMPHESLNQLERA